MKIKTILIMPVKFKSLRLKNKNILPIKGMPMFVYTMMAINKSKKIDKFYVSTESNKIIKICKKYKIDFIRRPYYLARPESEKQSVIVHGLKNLAKIKIKPKVVISLQANSPQTKMKDIHNALNFFHRRLYPNYPIKELISVGNDNIQNASFRIMTYKAAFQRSLSTKIGVFFSNCLDIHTYNDYIKVKKSIET